MDKLESVSGLGHFMVVEILLDNSTLDIRLSDEDKENSLNTLEKYLRKGRTIPLVKDEGLTLDMEEVDLFKQIPVEKIYGSVKGITVEQGKAIAAIQCSTQHVDEIKNAKLVFIGKYINLGLPHLLLSTIGKGNKTPEFIITGAVLR